MNNNTQIFTTKMIFWIYLQTHLDFSFYSSPEKSHFAIVLRIPIFKSFVNKIVIREIISGLTFDV